MTDVFEVQDEIAGAWSSNSRSSCSAMRRRAEVTDPKAYALFLRANALQDQQRWRHSGSRSRFTSRRWRSTLAYLEAWRELAALRINESSQRASAGRRSLSPGTRIHRKALTRRPRFAPAHDGLAVIALYHDSTRPRPRSTEQRALALDPTNPNILINTTDLALTLGKHDLGIEVCRVCRGTRSSQRHGPGISRFPIPGSRPTR